MHSHIILLLKAAAMVSAFPHMAEMAKSHQLNKRIAPVAPFPEYPGSPAHANYDNFDAASQLIDVTGEHAWAAPTAGQIRGPCAGLNAAANHGYIPRSGIATADSISQGLWQAFSLSLDATTFLETATRFFDGNPITGEWSIGPASSAVNLIDGTTPSGICEYGHLKTEADASITRGDCKDMTYTFSHRVSLTATLFSPRSDKEQQLRLVPGVPAGSLRPGQRDEPDDGLAGREGDGAAQLESQGVQHREQSQLLCARLRRRGFHLRRAHVRVGAAIEPLGRVPSRLPDAGELPRALGLHQRRQQQPRVDARQRAHPGQLLQARRG